MICLDTNYLIRDVEDGSPESMELVKWIKNGNELITPMPAWYEFLCGPVTKDQISTMEAFLFRVVPFSDPEAITAPRLFNLTNRKRSLRFDSMIAATAIEAGASLATNNLGDFELFVPHGLELA